MAKRTCKGKTRKGRRCRAAPLRGQEYCAAHDPVSPGFGTPEQAKAAGVLGGRPKLVRPSEIAQQLIEDNALAIQRPFWRALGYDVVKNDDGTFSLTERPGGGAKVHATFQGIVYDSDFEDLAAMQAAAEKLMDRAYGKPTQTTALTGADGGAVRVEEHFGDPEVREGLHELIRRVGAARAGGAGGPGAGD